MNHTVQTEALKAEISGLTIPLGKAKVLYIDRVVMEGRQLSLETSHLPESIKGKGTLRAFLREESLLALARQQCGDKAEVLSVQVEPGALSVEIQMPLAFTKMKASLSCGLESPDGKSLCLTLIEVKLLGVSAKTLASSFLASINPIFETSMLGLDCRIVESSLTAGELCLTFEL